MAVATSQDYVLDQKRNLFVGTHVVKIDAIANDQLTVRPMNDINVAGYSVLSGSAPTRAQFSVLFNAQDPDDGDTIVIAGRTYSFESGAIDAADKIDISGTPATQAGLLIAAINASGTAGTDYGTGTTQNQHFRASLSPTSTATVILSARRAGVSGNGIAVSKSDANDSYTLAGLSSGATGTTTGAVGGNLTVLADTNGSLNVLNFDGFAIGDLVTVVTLHGTAAGLNYSAIG